MSQVQQVQTPKFVEIDLPQPGNSVSALVRDVAVTVDQTCSGVRHVDAGGSLVSWSKSGHLFPAYDSHGWSETWTCPSGATFQVESNGKVRILAGGGRDPSVYDMIVTEIAP